MNEIKKTIEYIIKKCKSKDFKGINDWIDENILCKKAGIEEIKGLICAIEAELNDSGFYSIVAIVYAIVLVAASLIPEEFKIKVFGILILCALLLVVYSIIRKKKIEQKTFLLKILYFRLEEINNDERNSIKTDEVNEYREYIIQIKEK